MERFDFILGSEFRQLLEADYDEMYNSVSAKAWKAAQVLAGSIIEALLIDYLVATPETPRTLKDPLKCDLSEAIAICQNEDAISNRAASLCSVIRSYRNLIHPGRQIRTGELPPSKTSAGIAVSVVDLVIEEIANKRKKTLGLTAEQIASKVVRDVNALTILKHLLSDASPTQLERLLTDVLPTSYFNIKANDNVFEPQGATLARLSNAYGLAFETSSEEIKCKAARHFVQILREGDGNEVDDYSTNFFGAEIIGYVDKSQQDMVRHHFLERLPTFYDKESDGNFASIYPYLTTADIPRWLDPFIKTYISPKSNAQKREHILNKIGGLTGLFQSDERDKAIDGRLDQWLSRLDSSNSDQATLIKSLKEDIEADRLPF